MRFITALRAQGNRTFPVVGVVALACIAVSAQAATSYRLTILAKDGDIIGGQTIRRPFPTGLNDGGIVVFTAIAPCSRIGGCDNVYKVSPSTPPSLAAGPGTVIAGQTLTGAHSAVIANSGTIAFRCGTTSGEAICTQSAVLVRVGDTIGGVTIESLGGPVISGNGTIVFTGESSRSVPEVGSLSASALFTPSGLLLKTCESLIFGAILLVPCHPSGASGDSVAGRELVSIAFPAVNDSGTIVFFGGWGDGQVGVFTLSELLAQAGSTIAGHVLLGVGLPHINNPGSVVFAAQLPDAELASGIFTPSSVLVRTGDTVAGHTLDVVIGAQPFGRGINDNGTIVYGAHFVATPGFPQGWGAFTQSDLVAKSEASVGGKTLGFSILPVAINNRGDIVMFADFLDGTQGVLLAEPELSVGIQIKDGESPATINANSSGKIPVAVLSDGSFDAPGVVDRGSLRFGRTGDEQSLAFCEPGGRDVNDDGRPDLMCFFGTKLSAFQPGDTSAVLKGKTLVQAPFTSSRLVRIVP